MSLPSPLPTENRRSAQGLIIIATLACAAGALVAAWAISSFGPPAEVEMKVNNGASLSQAANPETARVAGGALVSQTTPEAVIANLAMDSEDDPEEDSGSPDVTAGTPDAWYRWRHLETDLSRLQERVAALETALRNVESAESDSESSGDSVSENSQASLDTNQQKRNALISAGLTEDWAADILWQQSQAELQRLELRDQALREGWINSDRYREALRELQGETPRLRSEIGDDAYDRYLYAMGQSNRVLVNSVIEGSPAEYAGLQPGDMILSYADRRLFQWTDLRSASSDGERGETVMMDVQRGTDRFQLAIPRGPLGVRLGDKAVELLQ